MKQNHEVDSFLKIVWMITESPDYFKGGSYRNLLRQAEDYLHVLMSQRCQLENVAELVVPLQKKLTRLMG